MRFHGMFARSPRRTLIIVVALALAVLAFESRRSKSISQHGFSGDAADFALPVAVINVGGNDFLLANYQNVALFNKASGAINKVHVENLQIVPKFIPTSLAMDHATGRIFIANYLANDVIIASLDKSDLKLHLDRVIGDERTLSPEGVAVSGNIVAVANSDGDNVELFDETKPGTDAGCIIAVAQAHGITFMGGFAYATSLTDRSLVKIDPNTCRIVAKTGEAGWAPGQFLWPTQVAAWDDKSIAVTDAHTGLISVWDAKSLEFQTSFGGNGPGQNELNMPYGFAIDSSNLLVTSTFGAKIVRFDKASHQAVESWSSRPNWKNMPDGSRYTLNRADHAKLPSWDAYTEVSSSITVDGKCYHPGYGELVSCAGGESLEVKMNEIGFTYFIQVARAGERLLVFSPQAAVAMIVGPEGWAQRKSVPIGLDHWLVAGKVVGPYGEFRF